MSLFRHNKRTLRKTRQVGTDSRGVTLVELILVTAVAGILVVSVTTIMLYFYGDVIRSHNRASLAVESQSLLRNVVEELRISSAIRENNSITDVNSPPGGWTTSNSDLVLIISTPAFDSGDDYIINPVTGYPYQNEIIYFVDGQTLYKRILANPLAVGNQAKTSCPAASSSATCPSDVTLSQNFEEMSFVFYDQNDNITNDLSLARSIELELDMLKKSFGKDITYANDIRMTLRNINY